MRLLTPVYRVVARNGYTVAEYVDGAVVEGRARERALTHATRIGGKVFHVDEHGYLALIANFG